MGKLDGLHPKLAELYGSLRARAEAQGHAIIITQGFRSIAEQDGLYAIGRTVFGSPCKHRGVYQKLGSCAVHPFGLTVTKARGGSSYHNFGLAFDIAVLKNGKPTWEDGIDLDGNHVWDYVDVGLIGESLGLEWGGRWKFLDVPHFQYTFGLTLEQLRGGARP